MDQLGSSAGGVNIRDFEMAVLYVTDPPVAGMSQEQSEALTRATLYIQQLSRLPNAYQLCVQLLMASEHSAAKFFSLQALGQYVGSGAYKELDDVPNQELRNALIVWFRSRGVLFAQEPAYVRMKLALVFALMIKHDYPQRWATAFHDLLGSLNGEPAGVDLFLRILGALHDEVVDSRLNRTDNRSPAELSRNTAIKDAMRATHVVGMLVDFWYSALAAYSERMPHLAAHTLSIMAEYVAWIDITLIANDRFVPLFVTLLSNARLRGGVARVLYALIDKGMDTTARLDLIRSLRLVDLLSMVTSTADALQHSDEEDAYATAATAAAAGADSPGNAVALGHTPTADFGTTIAQLLCFTGQSLLAAGEHSAVLGNKDAMAWAATAIRACCGMALGILQYEDCALAYEVTPLILDMITLFTRELKATSGAGSSSPLLGAMAGNGLPSNGSSQSITSAEAMSSSADSIATPPKSARLSNTGSSGGKGTGSGSQLPRAYEGRPAGVSMTDYMGRVLQAVTSRYAYPSELLFPQDQHAQAGNDMVDDEDVANFKALRDQLRRAYINITRVAPDDVLAYLRVSFLTDDNLSSLASLPFPNAEATLSLLYLYGEAAAHVNTQLRSGAGILFDALVKVFSSGVHLHPHHVVILQYYELAARYHGMFVQRPDILPSVLEAMIGRTGLRHASPAVRSRSTYLLLKLVKSIVKCENTGEQTALMPFVDPILTGIEEFLLVPFVSRSALSRKDSAADGQPLTARDFSVTRRSSGLGSDDQQYLFEIVGVLLGQPWIPLEKKIGYTEAVMNPLLAKLEDGLRQIDEASSRVSVRSPSAIQNGEARSPHSSLLFTSADTSGWSAEFVAEVAAWIVRVMNAIGHITKGFGNVSQLDRLALLQERALAASLRVMSVLPTHPAVRNKALFLMHRMVDCLDTRLIPHLPSCLMLLLSASTAEDMSPVLILINQLVNKFKQQTASLFASFLLVIVSRVCAVIRMSASNLMSVAKPASRSRRKDSDVTVDPGGVDAGTLVTTDEARSRVELGRNYVSFFHALVTTGIATDVLCASCNVAQLFEVLPTVLLVGSTVNDVATIKTGMVFFSLLVKQWLPVASHNLTHAAAGSAFSSIPPHQLDMGMQNVPSKTRFTSAPVGGKVTAQPSPLPDPLRSQFINFLADEVNRATFSFVLTPGFDAGDAQCNQTILEGISLQATIAVHVAAATGSPAPSKPVSTLETPTQGIDTISQLINLVLPALGVPIDICVAYAEKLRQCLSPSQQKDAKNAYLTVAKLIRTSGASHQQTQMTTLPVSSSISLAVNVGHADIQDNGKIFSAIQR